MAASAASASHAGTTATIFPSLATWSGSYPSMSHAALTSGRTGTDVSSTSIMTPLASANSFKVLASPPRVGSRKQRVPGAAASTAATRWLSGAASLAMPPGNESPPRLAMTAIP